MTSEQDSTRINHAMMGVEFLRIAVLYGAVLTVFSAVEFVYSANAEAMLVVGWLCFFGLLTIGVVNYLDGRKS